MEINPFPSARHSTGLAMETRDPSFEFRLCCVEQELTLHDVKLKTQMARLYADILRDIMNGLLVLWIAGLAVAVMGRVVGAW